MNRGYLLFRASIIYWIEGLDKKLPHGNGDEKEAVP